MERSFYPKLAVALVLGLVVVFVFDRLDVSALSAPLCLAVVLMGLSLRQSPPLVVAVSLIYTVLVTYAAVYVLYHSNRPHLPFPYSIFGLVQRVGVFIVVCSMAIYMSFYRVSSERLLADVRNTLSKLPIPVVISDAEGIIIYTNEFLNVSFKQLPRDLAGKQYMDFFTPGVRGDKETPRYIELFHDEEADIFHEMDIKPLGGSDHVLARLTCIGTEPNRVMITVFQPPDSTLRRLWARDRL